MAEALIFLILLGCDDGERQCDVLGLSPLRFESKNACAPAASDFIERSLDAPYPMLVAHCGTAAEIVDHLRTVASPAQVAAARSSLEAIEGRPGP